MNNFTHFYFCTKPRLGNVQYAQATYIIFDDVKGTWSWHSFNILKIIQMVSVEQYKGEHFYLPDSQGQLIQPP